jgi:hypothetical protein
MARRALAAQHTAASQADSQVHPREVFDLHGWDGEQGAPVAKWDSESSVQIGFEC